MVRWMFVEFLAFLIVAGLVVGLPLLVYLCAKTLMALLDPDDC